MVLGCAVGMKSGSLLLAIMDYSECYFMDLLSRSWFS